MVEPTIELFRYKTATGEVPYSKWLLALDDNEANRVSAHVDRMKAGNFGDSKPVGHGVSERRINWGPGYRAYYLRDGVSVVILLCGGDKGSQRSDIRRAHEFAADYWRRK